MHRLQRGFKRWCEDLLLRIAGTPQRSGKRRVALGLFEQRFLVAFGQQVERADARRRGQEREDVSPKALGLQAGRLGRDILLDNPSGDEASLVEEALTVLAPLEGNRFVVADPALESARLTALGMAYKRRAGRPGRQHGTGHRPVAARAGYPLQRR